MNKQLFIVPRSGLKVVDPLTRNPINPEGELVDKTTYWQRRILCGDVVEGKQEEIKINDEQPIEDVGGDQ